MLPNLARGLHLARGIGLETAITHCPVEDCREHTMAPLDRSRRPVNAQLGDPSGDLGVTDRADTTPAPGRLDMHAPRALVAVEGRRFHRDGMGCQPRCAKLADGDPRLPWGLYAPCNFADSTDVMHASASRSRVKPPLRAVFPSGLRYRASPRVPFFVS